MHPCIQSPPHTHVRMNVQAATTSTAMCAACNQPTPRCAGLLARRSLCVSDVYALVHWATARSLGCTARPVHADPRGDSMRDLSSGVRAPTLPENATEFTPMQP